MIKKILKILGISLLILIGVPLIIGQVLRLISHTEPPPGQMVDVGGYKLHINCISPDGTAAEDLPTVIFEAGAGVTTPVNYWIQNGVSKTTNICVYDRAGIGWSEESNLPRDAKTVNEALHTLLDKSNIKRPFVFAGHSIAGLYMRDYVERYPDEVIGIAFLDPSHPKQYEMFNFSESQRKELDDSVVSQISTIDWLIKFGVLEVYNPLLQVDGGFTSYPEKVQKQMEYLSKRPTSHNAFLAELRDFDKAAKQAENNKTLGDRPIVVISATKPWDKNMLPDFITPESMKSVMEKMHEEITALSTNGKRVKIDTADHMGLITNKDNAAKAVPYIIEVLRESANNYRSSQKEKAQTNTEK
ncbi:MAG: alpha/beta hydrolase [Acidobacteria bacterium]|nr:alpha/beta hydrolase [Acidobacteriota bacterium]